MTGGNFTSHVLTIGHTGNAKLSPPAKEEHLTNNYPILACNGLLLVIVIIGLPVQLPAESRQAYLSLVYNINI